MLIIGIETSCDETGASVVKDGKIILSNVVASSVEMHKKTGGIIPEQAAREQIKSIIPVINEALNQAIQPSSHPAISNQKMAKWLNGQIVNKIDAIAVTVGPGLIGSLLVGVETAKTLAYVWGKPIIPVNHLVGHIYANWLLPEQESKRVEEYKSPKFPALALVVSGGHTDLVLMKDHADIEWIGGTRDDAAGEAFDKTARLLGLGFPGGPAIAAEAAKLSANSYKLTAKLPRPLMNEETFDFSFSGLKTAVMREVNNNQPFSHLAIQQLAHEVQEAITDVLVDKTLKAVQKYKTPTLLLAGGVAANSRLREKMQQAIRPYSYLTMYAPLAHLCTDNAAMIASAAYFNYTPIDWRKITANSGLEITDINPKN